MRFLVIYITPPPLKKAINAVRLLCDPLVKHPAHITVRGPYLNGGLDRSKANMDQFIEGKDIFIGEAGAFFEGDQSTVFLRCDSQDLKSVYKKFNYPDYNPHLTLYDGSSRSFAEELFAIARKRRFSLRFQAAGLESLASTKIKKERIMHQRFEFPTDFVFGITGRELHASDIDPLSESDRLSLVDDILGHLEQSNAGPPIAKLHQVTAP